MSSNHKLIKSGIIFLIFSFFVPTVLHSQEMPSDDDLEARILGVLPPFWQIIDYDEIAAINNNDPVSPELSIRFEATVSNQNQLFLKSEDMAGPFTVILDALAKGTSRTLYGTIVLRYSAGSWNGLPVIENPIDGLGQPIDLFTIPTVILGTQNHIDLLVKLREDSVDASNAALDRQLADLNRAYSDKFAALEVHAEEFTRSKALEIATLSTENSTQINDVLQEHQRALGELNLEFENAQTEMEHQLANLNSSYTDKFANLKINAEEIVRENAIEIAALLIEHTSEVNDLNVDHQQVLAKYKQDLDQARFDLNREQEAQIERRNAVHAKNRGELIAAMEQELAALEMGFSVRLEKFTEMSADSEQTLALQEKLIEARQVMLDNESWLLQLNAEQGLARKELVGALKGIWSGQVSCGSSNSRYAGYSFAFTANMPRFSGGNLAGTIETVGQVAKDGPMPALMVIHGNQTSYPVRVTFDTGVKASYGRHELLDFELELGEDGNLTGYVPDENGCKVSMSK